MTLSPLPTKCIGACVLCTRMDQWCVGSFKKKFSGIVIEFEFFFFFLSAPHPCSQPIAYRIAIRSSHTETSAVDKNIATGQPYRQRSLEGAQQRDITR